MFVFKNYLTYKRMFSIMTGIKTGYASTELDLAKTKRVQFPACANILNKVVVMPKYNIFKEMKAEWPLLFRIKFNIRTFPMHMKLKLSFLWCDVKALLNKVF